ncbi:glycosyltransferase [Aeromonas veronii]|uniref:glycosyltransferase family 2 protein n=1 Tax=Aeromonas veronii TaxID=654 RepID=UPI00094718F5|nr:glycosyltransferase family 2 protein [Aeromonas veronii]OLF57801.1 glycosyltransferase [Aeromonas veronii]
MNANKVKDLSTSVAIPSLAIVVPCYNETDAFPRCLSTLLSILRELINNNRILASSYIQFVDDGSRDSTWQLIKQATTKSPHVKGLKLSRNYGHQIALIAGLSVVDTDISISIDADLQDDINCIFQMVDKYMQGIDVVYGVRNDRSRDSAFKRVTANSFYKFMSIMGVKQIENHADYRLLSRRALQSLMQFKERNVYIRGMVPLLGFKSEKVFYSRNERIEGESKYPLRKMLALAVEGITSLTVTPLRIIAVIGFLTFLLSLIASIYTLVQRVQGSVVEGWTSVIISIFLLGGIQLLCLGVIGEYIGKIYMETKCRPKFIVDEFIDGAKFPSEVAKIKLLHTNGN